MARKITKRQQQIYDFIKEYQQEKGYPPSVREMASAVGLSSPSTVHAHLSALEARGLLKRDATMTLVGARQARAELEFFYQQLLERQPGLVGGKLPPAAFYAGRA